MEKNGENGDWYCLFEKIIVILRKQTAIRKPRRGVKRAGICKKLNIKRLSAPSDIDWAMREASTSRMATDTGTHAFFVSARIWRCL